MAESHAQTVIIVLPAYLLSREDCGKQRCTHIREVDFTIATKISNLYGVYHPFWGGKVRTENPLINTALWSYRTATEIICPTHAKLLPVRKAVKAGLLTIKDLIEGKNPEYFSLASDTF
jgi:hypothetical protein